MQSLTSATQSIRNAVSRVSALREIGESNRPLQAAIIAVKRFQAQRFANTYADMLQSGPYSGAARFFLDELYSDKDYSQRDAQFSRIAGALQSFFPKQVVATAVSLAELHALSEGLDYEMGSAWLAQGMPNGARPPSTDGNRYVTAWRAVGRETDRALQLKTVLRVGEELAKLTQTPGLRLMLKMMRRPAQAAGLDALQRFLETGFDTFAQMNGRANHAKNFLTLIEARESALIDALFSGRADNG